MHRKPGSNASLKREDSAGFCQPRHALLAYSAFFIAAFSTVFPLPRALAFPAQFGLAPDNNRDLLISTIRSARKSLLINIYQFDQAAVADAIIDRVQAGLAVQLLIEGQPFGQVSPESKKALAAIRSAMKSESTAGNQIFVMSSAGPGTRRFRYNHAKYVVVDQAKLLVSSENFTATGHAVTGEVGNRGWSIVLEDRAFAAKLVQIFRADTDLSNPDVKPMLASVTLPERGSPEVEGRRRSVPATAIGTGNVASATLLTSPDAREPLLNMIRSSKTTIDVEEASLPSTWKDPQAIQNPIVTELLNAAKRGVRVRVLLNDDGVFARPDEGRFLLFANTGAKPLPNEITAGIIQQAGHCENLSLEARIVDVKAADITYIHNKGMIFDGDRVLVSSINGTRNSVMNNREVAVLVESRDAAIYYGGAFDFDWTSSPRFPTSDADCGRQRAASAEESAWMPMFWMTY